MHLLLLFVMVSSWCFNKENVSTNFLFFFFSSMISLILYSSHLQLLHWLLLCSWTILLITRIAPKIGECHGGPGLEHLMEIAVMKSSIHFLSTSTGFSLHGRKVSYTIKKRCYRKSIIFLRRVIYLVGVRVKPEW